MQGDEERSSSAQQADRVLVAEDNRDSADTVAMFLRLNGYEVRVCYDGPSAIAEFEKWRPTVAIIDIGLPGALGYAVAQQIRRLPSGSGVLLIALTAYAYPADLAKARYAGFNWHLAKPVSLATVLEILRDPSRAATRKDAVPLNSLPGPEL
jgi:CheY-like chemotaxis protein